MTETTFIQGIVIPVAWDEKGDVQSVAIATYNEEKYLVVDYIQSRKLLSLLHRRVVVYGILGEQGKEKVIAIDKFREDKSKVMHKKKYIIG